MAKIIGVYKASGTPVARFFSAVGRLVGSYPCDLSRLTHGPSGKKKQWQGLCERLATELGHEHVVVFPNLASSAYQSASSGREPCVLLEDDSGSLSMILDWNDLSAAGGDVSKYEQIIRSKLLMY